MGPSRITEFPEIQPLIEVQSPTVEWQKNNYHSKRARWLGRAVSAGFCLGIPPTLISGIKLILNEHPVPGGILIIMGFALSILSPATCYLADEEKYDDPKTVATICKDLKNQSLEDFCKKYGSRVKKLKINKIINEETNKKIEEYKELINKHYDLLTAHPNLKDISQNHPEDLDTVEEGPHYREILEKLKTLQSDWEQLQQTFSKTLPNPDSIIEII